jgi:hypothetical protein
MGIEDGVQQSLGLPCRLTDSGAKRTYELTSSIVPHGTPLHRSGELGRSSYLVDPTQLSGRCRGLFPVHRNWVPSPQMRCRITANRRASAAIGFFDPALLGDLHGPRPAPDHFVKRTSIIWAASFISSPHFEIAPLRLISPD